MSRQHAYSREELLATARGELFSHSNARLPNDPMLMFDRITEIYADGGSHGKGIVNAELDIRPDLWFFGCHFLGDPVMPGCLGLDAMWQLTGFSNMERRNPRIRSCIGLWRSQVHRSSTAKRKIGALRSRDDQNHQPHTGHWSG